MCDDDDETLPLDVLEALEAVEAEYAAAKRAKLGGDDTIIAFYRHTDKWGELSNFYPLRSDVLYDGREWPTSEHLYQALKYDWSTAAGREYSEIIRRASTPYKAKLLSHAKNLGGAAKWMAEVQTSIEHGRRIGAKTRADWEQRKLRMMLEVLQWKFSVSVHCRDALLRTGTAQLEERSATDRFWGKNAQGDGENHLGRMLMTVRAHLINQK
jgi:ribA/ribD-fused uncharacterized protein